MSTENTNRNPAISISRIVGMFFIVICHIIKYYHFIPMHNSLGQFFNCGVQLFLFISGYLYGGKIIKNFKKWYAKRIVIIAIPSVIISILVIFALFIVGELPSINSIIAYCLDLEGLLFINWSFFSTLFQQISGLEPLWFTTIIMLCYLFIPLLQMITNKVKNHTRLLIVFLIFGIAISIALSNFCSLYYFIIFVFGYLSRKVNLLERIKTEFFLIYTFLFVFSIIGRIVLQKAIDGTFIYLSYVSISQIVIGTWFIVLFAFLYNKFPNIISKATNSKIVKTIDSYSFFIYLTHGIFCMDTFNLYNIFSLPVATVLFIIFTLLSAVILKLISSMISRLIFKK